MRAELGAEVSQRWLLYALGGGFGHLTRSLALARALQAASPQLDLHFVTNSPYARTALLDSELRADKSSETRRASVHVLDSNCGKERTCREVRDLLSRVDPQVLVADTFPRGIGGELAGWIESSDAVCILTHRDLNPEYVERFRLESFVSAHYRLVLAPGECGPITTSSELVRTPPWLIRGCDELDTFEEARRVFHANQSQPLVVVSRSGMPAESKFFEALAEELIERLGDRVQIRLIRPPGSSESLAVDSMEIWPLLQSIRGVDAIVGAAGYNTVVEARSSGTPLLSFPQSRLYDRQQRRLTKRETMANIDQVVARLESLATRYSHGREIPAFVNGAEIAAESCLAVSAIAADSQSILQPSV